MQIRVLLTIVVAATPLTVLAAQSSNRLDAAADGAGRADRGKAVYAAHCAQCHGEDLQGTSFGDGVPALKRDDFMAGRTAKDVFEQMKRAMPFNAPASLKESEYVDVFTYLLRENGSSATGLPFAPGAAQAVSSAGTGAIWSGVFTTAQADRGKGQFVVHCSQCHQEDLSGANGPELAGPKFRDKWDSASVGELFAKASKSMPRNAPGTLDPKDYIDVVAHILRSNGFPAGERELTVDPGVLSTLAIVGRDGPAAVQPGQLVRAVGCFGSASPNVWQLTRASVPIRSRNPDFTPDERGGLARVELGRETFRLFGVDPTMEGLNGRRVALKGLFQSNGIAVTSLEKLADGCGE